RLSTDSVIVAYVDVNGAAAVQKAAPRFSSNEVHTREAHVEDWIALLIANHLFAGADAFVSAQLWDVPAGVSLGVLPTSRGGTAITASFRW
ncbi:MAG TPA: hypothetical protein VFX39_10575, partial [Gemmatimonadaceae bacterium]|nr:hypothetical protein [Gemmatimonadaceae bacterium]